MKITRNKYRFLLFLVASHLVPLLSLFSQGGQFNPAPLFSSEEMLRMTIVMDVKAVLRDVGDDRREHPAEIIYHADGKEITVPLKVRTRGHFRRDPMNCDFPPLRLNFAKETSANSMFEGQDKLKLVTHCRTRGNKHEQNVLKEYLAYRIYNHFTEESYRVRLVEMAYADSKGKKDTLYKMGFLIEPTSQLLKRCGCEKVDIPNVRPDQCDRTKTNIMAVFQYMIGNTDWSIPAGHNVILMRSHFSQPPVAVPYDFDWCGLVDAVYAVPNPILGIENVKVRLFRGYCRTEEEFEQGFQEFRNCEEEIYRLVGSIPRLAEQEQKKISRYLDYFYKTINNPRSVQSEIHNVCRSD